MSTVLRCDSIGKAFGERTVLSSAYLEARAGGVTLLVGRNGAGKSTLLKIAAGWLQPDHGFVEFAGERHLRPQLARFARQGLFLLPVEHALLSPGFTLGQHIDALEHRFGSRADRRAALERLGIAELEHVPCAALSGGERRRAELALAWLRRPVCLLVDEPLRGVDPKDRETIVAVVREIAAQGCAVVASGHEVDWILEMGDEFVWVHDSTTERLGDRAGAEAHWHFRKGYLGKGA
jgi:ABC-type multidrug transport system ATPase subunit